VTTRVVTGPRPAGEWTRRLRHLPVPLLALAGVLVVGGVIGALVRGPVGVAGVAAGTALVAVSYVLSSLAIAWADRVNPRMVLPVGLTAYAVKFLLFGLLMIAVSAKDWPGLVPMGIAIVVAALTWSAAQAGWTWKARIPYVEPVAETTNNR
jgi:hypothetical protein